MHKKQVTVDAFVNNFGRLSLGVEEKINFYYIFFYREYRLIFFRVYALSFLKLH